MTARGIIRPWCRCTRGRCGWFSIPRSVRRWVRSSGSISLVQRSGGPAGGAVRFESSTGGSEARRLSIGSRLQAGRGVDGSSRGASVQGAGRSRVGVAGNRAQGSVGVYLGATDGIPTTEDDRTLAAAALAEIAPVDEVWGLVPRAFADATKAAGGADRHASEVAKFVAGQPSRSAVSSFLVDQLEEVKRSDPEKAKALRAQLRQPRFQKDPLARIILMRSPERPTAPGKSIPDLQVDALEGGGTFSTASLKGKVYWLELWATWCAPCVKELPVLHKVFAKYGKRAARPLHILSISFDPEAFDVKAFRKGKFPMPWEHARPSESQLQSLSELFGEGIPFYALVDETGRSFASTPDLHAKDLPGLLDKMDAPSSSAPATHKATPAN